MNSVDLQAKLDEAKAATNGASRSIGDLAVRFEALRAEIEKIGLALNAIQLDPPTIVVADPVGDVTVDHVAIQSAINAAALFPLRTDGLRGIVRVPAGRYVVDAVKGITVRPHVRLEMDVNTFIAAAPNTAKRYTVLRAESDCQIVGGTVVGERLTHDYDAIDDGTDEWGYVLMVSGDRVWVENLILREGTGDGLGVSGADNVFRNVRCLHNRRNGLSVFAAKRAVFSDCEFSDTGDYLHDVAPPKGPCAGVDIEPDGNLIGEAPNICDGVVFQRCIARRNRSAGFKTYKTPTAAVPAQIRNVRFEDCVAENNGGDGMWLAYVDGVGVTSCMLQGNAGYGLHLLLGANTGVPIEKNHFFNNLTRLNTLDRTPDDLDREGLIAANNRDLKVESTAGVCVIGRNSFL
jgi:polygalacturonase